jgi:hypothetical protein
MFSTTATPVYCFEVKIPRGLPATQRIVAGFDSGRLTAVEFLKALIGTIRSAIVRRKR